MKLEFTKMQGIGNDYIYVDCTRGFDFDPCLLSRKLSDRHFGIGGDGLVLICASKVADFSMRMFNADGSEGKMCGNATRCIGKYVYDKGLTDKTVLTLETKSGIKTLSLEIEEQRVRRVSVDMGQPKFAPADIPTTAALPLTVTVNGKPTAATAVSMGNPHLVITVPDTDTAPVHTDGPVIEVDERFPERINVEFVEVISPTHLKMRVWERGSGETLACGTGACATVAAAVQNHISPPGEPVTVELLGGNLEILYDGQNITMTGGAEFVFEGTVEI